MTTRYWKELNIYFGIKIIKLEKNIETPKNYACFREL